MTFVMMLAMVAVGAMQTTETPLLPLPVSAVEACKVTFPAELTVRVGYVSAVYDARTDATGMVISLNRRIMLPDRDNLPKYVKLQELEDCLRRWKFGDAGDVVIRFRGGSTYGGFWIIDAIRDSRMFSLRVPVVF